MENEPKGARLLKQLRILILEQILFIEKMDENSEIDLNWRKGIAGWNVLECIEHLNIYGRYYLPRVKDALAVKPLKKPSLFANGKIGHYFIESLKPKPVQIKLKTLKKFDPQGQVLDKSALYEFQKQLNDWQTILSNLNEFEVFCGRISVSILPLLKLSFAEVLQIVLFHNERHINQMKALFVDQKNDRAEIID